MRLRNKHSQISSMILVMTAAMVLLASFSIYSMRSEVVRTQTAIAAQSGAMYLSSLVGSYAYAMACQSLGCSCKKSKSSWGWGFIFLAVALVVAITGHPEIMAKALTSKGLTSAMLWGGMGLGAVADEVRWRKALKQVDKMLEQFAKDNPREMFKWATIAYIAQQLSEDPGVMEYVVRKMSKVPKRNKNFNPILEDFFKNKADRFLAKMTDPFNIYGWWPARSHPDVRPAVIHWFRSAYWLNYRDYEPGTDPSKYGRYHYSDYWATSSARTLNSMGSIWEKWWEYYEDAIKRSDGKWMDIGNHASFLGPGSYGPKEDTELYFYGFFYSNLMAVLAYFEKLFPYPIFGQGTLEPETICKAAGSGVCHKRPKYEVVENLIYGDEGPLWAIAARKPETNLEALFLEFYDPQAQEWFAGKGQELESESYYVDLKRASQYLGDILRVLYDVRDLKIRPSKIAVDRPASYWFGRNRYSRYIHTWSWKLVGRDYRNRDYTYFFSLGNYFPGGYCHGHYPGFYHYYWSGVGIFRKLSRFFPFQRYGLKLCSSHRYPNCDGTLIGIPIRKALHSECDIVLPVCIKANRKAIYDKLNKKWIPVGNGDRCVFYNYYYYVGSRGKNGRYKGWKKRRKSGRICLSSSLFWTISMSSRDWKYWVNELISQVRQFKADVDQFIHDIDAVGDLTIGQVIKSIGGDFEYYWYDKMHRKHDIQIKVRFQMPWIRTKKSGGFFKKKVTYTLVGCQGTVYVCVMKDNKKYGAAVHYDSMHDVDNWTVRKSPLACYK